MKEENESEIIFRDVGKEFDEYGVKTKSHIMDILELFGRNEKYWQMKMESIMVEIEPNQQVIESKIKKLNQLRLFLLSA
jgi:hypothetical protein